MRAACASGRGGVGRESRSHLAAVARALNAEGKGSAAAIAGHGQRSDGGPNDAFDNGDAARIAEALSIWRPIVELYPDEGGRAQVHAALDGWQRPEGIQKLAARHAAVSRGVTGGSVGSAAGSTEVINVAPIDWQAIVVTLDQQLRSVEALASELAKQINEVETKHAAENGPVDKYANWPPEARRALGRLIRLDTATAAPHPDARIAQMHLEVVEQTLESFRAARSVVEDARQAATGLPRGSLSFEQSAQRSLVFFCGAVDSALQATATLARATQPQAAAAIQAAIGQQRGILGVAQSGQSPCLGPRA